MKNESPEPEACANLPTAAADVEALAALARRDPDALAEAIAAACPEDVRRDGWTGFSRRLFLQVLAETGRVALACEYTGLTKQSAYALRARDPLFAAGWDAACELARAPLADALYEKALDGVTETISRNGEVVATRHRFDSRLSIAVLHRLDKRCDRAEELGSPHLALLRNWDEWLRHIGRGEDEAAAALLAPPGGLAETAPHGQLGQLAESANPTGEEIEGDQFSFGGHCWKDPDGLWLTDFPPPPGYDGYESCEYGSPGEQYLRDCTEEESAILDAAAARRLSARETERDSWFAAIREELGLAGAAGEGTGDGEEAEKPAEEGLAEPPSADGGPRPSTARRTPSASSSPSGSGSGCRARGRNI